MRFFCVLLLVVLAAVGGWVFGSLRPAPAIMLDPVRSFLSNVDPDPPAILPEVSVPPDAEPDDLPEIDPPSQDRVPTVPDEQDEVSQYQTWIAEARAQYPYPETEERMFAVMMCESGGNAQIVNPAGPYSGLFQYSGATWSGDWNTYRDQDILDARAQIFATALAWSLNMQSHWGCYARSH